MALEFTEAFGWSKCLRLSNEDAELIVTTDIGPRVLAYRRPGGENVLRVFPGQMGRSGEPDYQVRGGHRLWTSPETELSYLPDNGPVEVELSAGENEVRLINAGKPPWNVRKELTLALAERGPGVTLRHRLINEGEGETRLASWGLTVMAPGGWQVIPQPPLGRHPEDLLPERVVVPWTYTDFSDERWRFGRQFWTLTPNPEGPPTKLGFIHQPGWVGYVLPHGLFVKTVPWERGATYPDFGCNYETFSKGDFIELETLSPLRTLAPGESVEHEERWHLFADTPPEALLDDAALAEWLRPLLAGIGLR